MDDDALYMELESLCMKHGLEQAILLFRDGVKLRLLGVASNPLDEAALEVLVPFLEKELARCKDAVRAAVREAAAKLGDPEDN